MISEFRQKSHTLPRMRSPGGLERWPDSSNASERLHKIRRLRITRCQTQGWNATRSHQLRAFLDAGGREALERLPDGIHSGLHRPGSRGVFIYFRGMSGDQKLNFWKYYDLKGNQILDNRHVLANLIACAPDTPRAVDQEVIKVVFDLQEKVIADILRSHEELAALQVAPQAIDPLQQTVATVIQNQLNHPNVDRKRAIAAIEFLTAPMLPVQLKESGRRSVKVFSTIQGARTGRWCRADACLYPDRCDCILEDLTNGVATHFTIQYGTVNGRRVAYRHGHCEKCAPEYAQGRTLHPIPKPLTLKPLCPWTYPGRAPTGRPPRSRPDVAFDMGLAAARNASVFHPSSGFLPCFSRRVTASFALI